jgi:phosphoribosyl 1,2-cyclic phosphodiesterase
VIRVRFWGTRGSIVTPGKETRRYGGNTACVEVVGYNGGTPGASVDPKNPRLILDAGTGLTLLQEVIMRGPARRGKAVLHLLLSHLHWDHVVGLPFFPPMFIKGNRVVFYGASEQTLRAGIERLFTSVYSPIKGTENLAAEIVYHKVPREGMDVDGFHVKAETTMHPSLTLAYRIQYGDRALVFCTDHEAGDKKSDQALLDLARGAHLFILDAQYAPDQAQSHRGWGHSSYEKAVELALESGVPTAVLFHHAPEHDDKTMDRIGEEAARMASGSSTEILVARDGMTLELV